MEYMYKLKLPGLSTVIKEEFKTNIIKALDELGKNQGILYGLEPDKLIDKQYLNILGIDFAGSKNCSLFAKEPDHRGGIHRDHANKNFFIWSINYVYNASGIQNYWEYSDVEEMAPLPNSENINIGRFTPLRRPSKKYLTEHDCVYLAHTSNPHSVDTLGNTDTRYAFVYRLPDFFNTPYTSWDIVLEHFKDYIEDAKKV